MARPERRDADYFPFYAKDGRTLFILQSKFGLEGIGFFTNLFRLLCMTPDHHICIAEEADRMYLFAKVGIEEARGIELLNLMATTGKIDAGLWQKQVIASDAFLQSLKDAYERRTNNCITIDEIRQKYVKARVSGDINPVNGDNNPVKGDINTQRKGKERKLDTMSGKTPDPIPYKDIVDYLNRVVGTNFKPKTYNTQKHIRGRWKDGARLAQFKMVIAFMAARWKGNQKMTQYLRPDTLFGPKFESYLEAAKKQKAGTDEVCDNCGGKAGKHSSVCPYRQVGKGRGG